MGKYINAVVQVHPELLFLRSTMEQAVSAMVDATKTGHKIMTCGNGGSAADAEHIVGELVKGFLLPRKINTEQRAALSAYGCPQELISGLQQGIRGISLVSGVALPTAFANDCSPELVFAQQVFVLGKTQDILLAISTSGNSANVIAAAQVARALGIYVISLTGQTGGKLTAHTDCLLNVPSMSTPTIQELHLPIYHALCADVEAILYS